ncbi:hypothetical protein [Sphingosinicella terrae]|jgi:hypothetical protein|uniref:hypothetical protein n=1 Tax=Sphingosinicella terrae TaxID=2172047 RepID=UPI000E0CE22C|nr:hypothetical protein [Sphingosinicella terrae]
MAIFTPNQWLVVLLVFLLGLFLGMSFLANPKWKRRYREEARLRAEETRQREALEAERKHWEARTIAERARDERPAPPPA